MAKIKTIISNIGAILFWLVFMVSPFFLFKEHLWIAIIAFVIMAIWISFMLVVPFLSQQEFNNRDQFQDNAQQQIASTTESKCDNE